MTTSATDEYRLLKTWDEKIEFIKKIRRRVGRKSRVMVEFQGDVCEFNMKRKIQEPIRSVFTGRFLQPGTYQYKKSLRYCNIIRHHSDCNEILTEGGDTLVDPVGGRRIKKTNRISRKIFNKCYRRRA